MKWPSSLNYAVINNTMHAISLAIICTGVIWASVISSAKALAADWQDPGYLQQAFVNVALKNEYDSAQHRVRKWRQPINIWLDHRVGGQQRHTRLTQMHISHLASITGHELRLVSTAEKANVHLVFTRQQQWAAEVAELIGPEAANHLHGAVCIANVQLNRAGVIVEARIVIPVDQAQMHGKLVACVVEELTQIMGLPNDSDAVFPSIFNDKTPQDLLSGLDGLLLKLLYHRDVKSGMSEESVRPILQRLLTQWSKDGTLMNAEQEIRQGELYPLLGYE